MKSSIQKTITTRSAEETAALGVSMGRVLSRLLAGKKEAVQAIVIALNGELGAGKTTLVGGLLRAMGVSGPIKSPTYTLIEPYELKTGELKTGTVYHLDLYRLADARDLEMLAPRDLLNNGSVLIVEWASRGGRALPESDLALDLDYGLTAEDLNRRSIRVVATSTVGNELADSLHGSADEAGLSS
jgi:tRNA threonylcarbamoyladenosine biosynthesis protein TsaE